MKTTATRFHDISCGHRVVGHEGKCRNLHGHNYRVHFTIGSGKLDALNRVIDFGVIKQHLCAWLERTIDHRFMVWEDDPIMDDLCALDPDGVIVMPFNPTAEAIGAWILLEGQRILDTFDGKVTLLSVKIEETYKCSAEVQLG